MPGSVTSTPIVRTLLDLIFARAMLDLLEMVKLAMVRVFFLGIVVINKEIITRTKSGFQIGFQVPNRGFPYRLRGYYFMRRM